MGSLALHKFVKLTEINSEFAELPKSDIFKDPFNYMLEVYMYGYIVLAIPRSRVQLHNFANVVMTGIHDVFLLYKDDDEDAISLKKILKRRALGQLLRMCWDLTIWLTEYCRIYILENLKSGLGKESI